MSIDVGRTPVSPHPPVARNLPQMHGHAASHSAGEAITIVVPDEHLFPRDLREGA